MLPKSVYILIYFTHCLVRPVLVQVTARTPCSLGVVSRPCHWYRPIWKLCGFKEHSEENDAWLDLWLLYLQWSLPIQCIDVILGNKVISCLHYVFLRDDCNKKKKGVFICPIYCQWNCFNPLHWYWHQLQKLVRNSLFCTHNISCMYFFPRRGIPPLWLLHFYPPCWTCFANCWSCLWYWVILIKLTRMIETTKFHISEARDSQF